MSYIKYIGLVTLVCTSLVFTAPAKAGNCCDSFWSCLGAVATAGLSCAAQAAVNEIEEILQHARDLFSLGQRVFDESIGTLNDAVVSATRGATDSFASVERNSNAHRRQASEISTRVDRDYDPTRPQLARTENNARTATVRTAPNGNEIATQSRTNVAIQNVQNENVAAQVTRQTSTVAEQIADSAGASTVSNNLTRAEMQGSMRAAMQRVNQLADKTGRDERRVFEDAVRGMERVHQTAVNHMRDVFSVSFAAPVSGVIGPLAATIADPISFLITARTMNLTLDRAIQALERSFPSAIGDANTQVNNQMQVITEKITTATNTTSEAGRIVNAMAELERNPTRYYFAQLNDLTGYSSTPTGPVARGTSVNASTLTVAPAPAASNNLATIDPELLRSLQIQFRPNITQQLSREMKSFVQESDRLQARLNAKQNTAQYEAQLDRYWDNYFKGKSSAEIEAKKRDLTNEINRKFSKDPEARNNALQMLDQQKIKYSAMLQSTPVNNAIRPVNPATRTVEPITQPNQAVKPVPQPNQAIKPITQPNQAIKPITQPNQPPSAVKPNANPEVKPIGPMPIKPIQIK